MRFAWVTVNVSGFDPDLFAVIVALLVVNSLDYSGYCF